MQQETIDDMARAIVANRTPFTTEGIIAALNEYWAGKIAIVWTRADVFGFAWPRSLLLTNEQADEVLDNLLRLHDPEQGVTWLHIETELNEIADDALDLTSVNRDGLPDYPGEFRVWWTEGIATEYNRSADFTADFQGGNLRAAVGLAIEKSKSAYPEDVLLCVINGEQDYPLAYFATEDGQLRVSKPVLG